MPLMGQMPHQGCADKHHDRIAWEGRGYCSLLFQHTVLTDTNLPSCRFDAHLPQHLLLTLNFRKCCQRYSLDPEAEQQPFDH